MNLKETGREMKLLIDAGNTRIKWALVEGQEWICRGELPTGLADKLSRVVAEQLAQLSPNSNLHDIKQIWASNVAGEVVSRNILGIGTGISAQIHFAVARESQCGVSNGYSSVSQLGSDRWTALISAWHIVKGKCLVVNSGTATTVDTLSGQGEFTGGLILPGVELMRRSLVESTDLLKSIRGGYMPFPLNTADAIYSGAIQATCGAIERQYTLLDDDSVPLVLSGGTADLLQPYFDRKLFKMPPRVVGNLVLRGLLVMAQEANCN
jgi:type III pantothenate kinase